MLTQSLLNNLFITLKSSTHDILQKNNYIHREGPKENLYARLIK